MSRASEREVKGEIIKIMSNAAYYGANIYIAKHSLGGGRYPWMFARIKYISITHQFAMIYRTVADGTETIQPLS